MKHGGTQKRLKSPLKSQLKLTGGAFLRPVTGGVAGSVAGDREARGRGAAQLRRTGEVPEQGGRGWPGQIASSAVTSRHERSRKRSETGTVLLGMAGAENSRAAAPAGVKGAGAGEKHVSGRVDRLTAMAVVEDDDGASELQRPGEIKKIDGWGSGS